ncbi:hypothetical protein BJV77DRAFT_1061805 [Russula vinacea]|nr:hypothetical protein BJV77DRAFT_1061805 [Russula vinacea]
MTQLAEAITNLATISNLHLASNLAGAKVVMRPTPYAGTGGDDARRFLAAFTMWAMAQGSSLNVVDGQGNLMDRRDGEWIRAALSFLVDDAAVWAAPAMEVFADGLVPFDNRWEAFAVDAKEKLRLLFQETSSIPEYAARFKQAMVRTGYSAADLRDRFYDHLHPKVKDELVHSNRPVVTLDDLIAATTEIDARVRQRQAEKERERRRGGMNSGTTLTPDLAASNPFMPMSSDPVKMEVDATRTREEFLRRMRGRCFGCGSTAHTKKDGNHEREVCHREGPKSQKAAATQEEEEVVVEDLSDDSLEEEEEEVKIAATSSDTLTQLLEQQKALAEQIAKWREEDF